jgi:Menin
MVEYIYGNPTASPMESLSWKALEHRDGDQLIENLDKLKEIFSSDMSKNGDDGLALWSCLLGYCEALSTHKKNRYSIYPIPFDALQRLVRNDFTPPSADTHRSAAQAVSNWIWANVLSKSNAKDELHANSLYTVLRGKVEGKSLDCFGAALCTVIGLRQLGFHNSVLTLSEDHAYESHTEGDLIMCTCEVAIPGNTKEQKSKRGQETCTTFHGKTSTPETSWLYMATCPVYCRTVPVIVAAALSNLNPLIEFKAQQRSCSEFHSKPLLIMKRELLWILKDAGYINQFPFALCELGWSEEHCTSPRGDTMVSVPELASVPVTGIEALYHDAIICSRTHYSDKQVYPYCYMGFFHKDGGQDDESRLGLALQYFSEAARVASAYTYEWGDTLQLLKTMTKLSEFIAFEILSQDDAPRNWKDEGCAISCGCWLVTFFDYLLCWEERGEEQFLPILKPDHKTGIAKAFALLPHLLRVQVFSSEILTTKSKRLAGSLREALQAPKVALSDMHLTIVSESRRTRKRKVMQS